MNTIIDWFYFFLVLFRRTYQILNVFPFMFTVFLCYLLPKVRLIYRLNIIAARTHCILFLNRIFLNLTKYAARAGLLNEFYILAMIKSRAWRVTICLSEPVFSRSKWTLPTFISLVIDWSVRLIAHHMVGYSRLELMDDSARSGSKGKRARIILRT